MKEILFNGKWHEAIFQYRQKRRYLRLFFSACFFPLYLLLVFIRRLCRRQIIPSSAYPKKEVKTVAEIFARRWQSDKGPEEPWQACYHLHPLRLVTPDGYSLSGMYFQHRLSHENSQVVILFQSGASIAKHGEYDWLLKKTALENHPTNFVTVDYRGCGESCGKITQPYELILDGDTLYQFVREGLKKQDYQLVFYGHFVGASIAAHIKYLYPNHSIKYINERACYSMTHWFSLIYPNYGPYFAWWLKKMGWDMNTLILWRFLQKGKNLVVYHPLDEQIPKKASLYYGLSKENVTANTSFIILLLPKGSRNMCFHHSAALSHYLDTATSLCAEQAVINFLFN